MFFGALCEPIKLVSKSILHFPILKIPVELEKSSLKKDLRAI